MKAETRIRVPLVRNGKKITTEFVLFPDEELETRYKATLARTNSNGPWYYRKFGALPDAWALPKSKRVYLPWSQRHNYKLIAHECEHIFGVSHTPYWKLVLMNPMSSLQWFVPRKYRRWGARVSQALMTSYVVKDSVFQGEVELGGGAD